MEDKLIEKLDDLNIRDTTILLDKDINISLDSVTRRRIEKNVLKKTGYHSGNIRFKDKVRNIFSGSFTKRKIALAASVVIILGLSGGGYVYAKTTPVAYVSVDINPSLELGINTFDEVISSEAYNEDGQKVLEGINLKGSDIDDAVSSVISKAISDGYIKEDGLSAIEITTATDKEKVAEKLNGALKDATDKALDNNYIEADVEIENVALERRDEARQLGITPGKLNLIEKLQELDPAISIEDYKTSSVKDIQTKTKELKKESNIEGASDTDNNENNTTNTINENTSNDVSSKDNTRGSSIDNSGNSSNISNSDNNNGNRSNSSNSSNGNSGNRSSGSNSGNSSNNNAKNGDAASTSNSKKTENGDLKDEEKNVKNTPESENNSNNLNSQKNDNLNSQDKNNNKEKNKNN